MKSLLEAPIAIILTMPKQWFEETGQFLGKKDFSMEDLPEIEKQIEECDAALKGIEAMSWWINVQYKRPDKWKEVAFIARSPNLIYNNRVMAGKLHSYKKGVAEFLCPGNLLLEGTMWFDLPVLIR